MSLILNDPRPLLDDVRGQFKGRAGAARASFSEHKDVIARVAEHAVRAAGRKGRPKLAGAAFLGFAAGVAALGARKVAMQATTGFARDWFATLKADHALADGLFKAIEETAEAEKAKRHLLFSKLVYALAKHQFEEEHVVYQALRDGGRAETPKHLASEHFDMKHLMHSLSEMEKDDARWLPTLRELHKLVAEHVREEEEIVFPALKARLSKKENANLSRAMHREGLKLA